MISDNFLSEALLYTFTREQGVPPHLPSKPNAAREELARIVFRSSVDSDYGKELRWSIERDLAKRLAGENFTRNELLDEPADILANRSAITTDILQEYFVPRIFGSSSSECKRSFLTQVRTCSMLVAE